jgi:hypothetical protein
MFRSPVLEEIRGLDPRTDHQRIILLSMRVDFPFDMTRALEFALFRTFSVPSISALLDKTGEFQGRPQKRYDDTDIIVSELIERGYDSERGRAALRRMNQLHGRFAIANDDFLYVLSTFIYEPIRWNERYGWRRMCEQERQAIFYFWREVGRRMNIKQIPTDYDAFERYNVEYEKAHFRFTEANHRVGAATCDLFASWFPRGLRPLVRRAIYALLDDALIQACGFPKPSPALRALVKASLKLRALGLRGLPRRRRPLLRTEMRQPSYPHGYQLEKLGPPESPRDTLCSTD